MFCKPFRYEEDCSNSAMVLDGDGVCMCQVIQEEDDLTKEDHAKLRLIVDSLNQLKTHIHLCEIE